MATRSDGPSPLVDFLRPLLTAAAPAHVLAIADELEAAARILRGRVADEAAEAARRAARRERLEMLRSAAVEAAANDSQPPEAAVGEAARRRGLDPLSVALLARLARRERARQERARRDVAIMRLFRRGLANAEIAARLGASESTVRAVIARERDRRPAAPRDPV